MRATSKGRRRVANKEQEEQKAEELHNEQKEIERKEAEEMKDADERREGC